VGGLLEDAFQAFRKAATAGHAAALSALGDLYQQGLGVSRNEREALDYYRKAAATGDAQGRARLGWHWCARARQPSKVRAWP